MTHEQYMQLIGISQQMIDDIMEIDIPDESFDFEKAIGEGEL